MAEELNAFLEGITELIEPEITLSIDELISEGESRHVEFKSSLRWDYKQSRINKNLEQVVLKTIAAFNNSDGGTLLIGVNDDGETLGLENDYQSLRGDTDSFERHLLNITDAAYGSAYSTSHIAITFPQVSDGEICMVEVSRGDSALYTTITDKNGLKAEKFFVRRGNASVELSTYSEVNSYIKRRFDAI